MSPNAVLEAGPRHRFLKRPPGSLWLTNGDVAWHIGDRRLLLNYYYGIYPTPEGWYLVDDILEDDWSTGICGEMRRIKGG